MKNVILSEEDSEDDDDNDDDDDSEEESRSVSRRHFLFHTKPEDSQAYNHPSFGLNFCM